MAWELKPPWCSRSNCLTSHKKLSCHFRTIDCTIQKGSHEFEFPILCITRSGRSQSFTQSVYENIKEPSIFQCITPFVAFLAWICSLVANFTCEFMTLDVTVGIYEYSLGFGMWSYQGWSYLVQSGNIYYSQTCFQYSDTVDPDSKWKSAQAFSIIAGTYLFYNRVCFSVETGLHSLIITSPCLFQSLWAGLPHASTAASFAHPILAVDTSALPCSTCLHASVKAWPFCLYKVTLVSTIPFSISNWIMSLSSVFRATYRGVPISVLLPLFFGL